MLCILQGSLNPTFILLYLIIYPFNVRCDDKITGFMSITIYIIKTLFIMLSCYPLDRIILGEVRL